jgi:site-specific recombinase XerD
MRDVYQHAVDFGYLLSSPVNESVLGEGPAPNERNGQVLPPGVFAALASAFPSKPTPWEKRDIAIMLLLMDTGMTSGELRDLEISHIEKNFTDPGQYWLKIDGPRGAQRRRISTRGPTGAALHRWMVYRNVMRRKTDVIFVSEKKGPMQRNTLFNVVARYVTVACKLALVDLPNHIGPGTIRNTAIVRWINSGEPINQICERIGVKDIRNLLVRLAPHITPVAMSKARELYATMNMPVGAQMPNDPLEPAPS